MSEVGNTPVASCLQKWKGLNQDSKANHRVSSVWLKQSGFRLNILSPSAVNSATEDFCLFLLNMKYVYPSIPWGFQCHLILSDQGNVPDVIYIIPWLFSRVYQWPLSLTDGRGGFYIKITEWSREGFWQPTGVCDWLILQAGRELYSSRQWWL